MVVLLAVPVTVSVSGSGSVSASVVAGVMVPAPAMEVAARMAAVSGEPAVVSATGPPN
jgi:hypothetical protein